MEKGIYKINWSNVRTIKDLKDIIGHLEYRFIVGDNNLNQFNSIEQLLIKEKDV